MEPLTDEIRRFVIDNFLFGIDEGRVANGTSLMEAGIVDSTGVLEIVAFLQAQYQVEIEAADILPSNFDSIDDMADFLRRKRGDAGPRTS